METGGRGRLEHAAIATAIRFWWPTTVRAWLDLDGCYDEELPEGRWDLDRADGVRTDGPAGRWADSGSWADACCIAQLLWGAADGWKIICHGAERWPLAARVCLIGCWPKKWWMTISAPNFQIWALLGGGADGFLLIAMMDTLMSADSSGVAHFMLASSMEMDSIIAVIDGLVNRPKGGGRCSRSGSGMATASCLQI
ncbi:hypothetical protein ACLOJK_038360 [Asimina triloba]